MQVTFSENPVQEIDQTVGKLGPSNIELSRPAASSQPQRLLRSHVPLQAGLQGVGFNDLLGGIDVQSLQQLDVLSGWRNAFIWLVLVTLDTPLCQSYFDCSVQHIPKPSCLLCSLDSRPLLLR